MNNDNPILNNPYQPPQLHYATDTVDGSLNYNDKRKQIAGAGLQTCADTLLNQHLVTNYHRSGDLRQLSKVLVVNCEKDIMARLTEKDISVLIKHLTQGDDYDEAMKHFMKVAEKPEIMDQSVDLPNAMKNEVESIFTGTMEMVNKYFKLKSENQLKEMKLFYIREFNLVHGIFIGAGIYGAAIYFSGIAKGACAIIRHGDPETHFLRITALHKPMGEA